MITTLLVLAGLVAAGLVYVYTRRPKETEETDRLSDELVARVIDALREKPACVSPAVVGVEPVHSKPAAEPAAPAPAVAAAAVVVEKPPAAPATETPAPAPTPAGEGSVVKATEPAAAPKKEWGKPIFVLWHGRGEPCVVRQRTEGWLSEMNRKRRVQGRPSIPFWPTLALAAKAAKRRNAEAAALTPTLKTNPGPEPGPREERKSEPATGRKPARRELSADEIKAAEDLAVKIKNRQLPGPVDDNVAAGHIVVKKVGAIPPFYRHGLDEVGLEAYKRSGTAHPTKGMERPFSRFYFRKEEADKRVGELNERFSRPAPSSVQPKPAQAPEPREEVKEPAKTDREPDPCDLEKEVTADGEATLPKPRRQKGKKGRKGGEGGRKAGGAVDGGDKQTAETPDARADREATEGRLAALAGKGVPMNNPFAEALALVLKRFEDGQAN